MLPNKLHLPNGRSCEPRFGHLEYDHPNLESKLSLSDIDPKKCTFNFPNMHIKLSIGPKICHVNMSNYELPYHMMFGRDTHVLIEEHK